MDYVVEKRDRMLADLIALTVKMRRTARALHKNGERSWVLRLDLG